MNIISFANQKGGVGKTTSCINLAVTLARIDKKVLLIDFDPSGNATLALGINPDTCCYNVFEFVTGNCTFEDALIKDRFGIDLIPANYSLAELDMVIIENRKDIKRPAHVLYDALKGISSKYDYVLIDLPPSLSLLTVNAFTASDNIIIVMQTEYLAAHGVNSLLQSIAKVKKSYNPKLNIMGILPTMVTQTNVSKDVLQDTKTFFTGKGIKVFDSIVKRRIIYGLAPGAGIPATVLAPDETIPYYELCGEVINYGK